MLTFERVSWRRSERLARLVLGRGSVVAQELGRGLTRFPTCWLLDPAGELTGHSLSGAPSDDGAADRTIDACYGTFVGCLPDVRSVFIEEAVAVPGNGLSAPGVPVGPYMLRWADVGDGLLEASRLFRGLADGTVECGFLSAQSSEELFLEPDEELSAPQVAAIVHSVQAVLVPMFGPGVMVAFCCS